MGARLTEGDVLVGAEGGVAGPEDRGRCLSQAMQAAWRNWKWPGMDFLLELPEGTNSA